MKSPSGRITLSLVVVLLLILSPAFSVDGARAQDDHSPAYADSTVEAPIPTGEDVPEENTPEPTDKGLPSEGERTYTKEGNPSARPQGSSAEEGDIAADDADGSVDPADHTGDADETAEEGSGDPADAAEAPSAEQPGDSEDETAAEESSDPAGDTDDSAGQTEAAEGENNPPSDAEESPLVGDEASTDENPDESTAEQEEAPSDGSGVTPLAQGTPELANPDATITGGTNADGSLRHDVPVSITVSFGVPVIGDGGSDFYERHDTVTLPLSDHFYFDPLPPDRVELRDPVGTLVGHITFQNSSATPPTAQAYIEFDGDEGVFDGSFNQVSVEFDAQFVFNGEYEEDDEGNHIVRILNKEVRFWAPGDTITETIEKSAGVPDLVNGTIEWTVTISAVDDASPPNTDIDLGGYEFVDDLTGVGEFVEGSVSPSGVALTAPGTDGVLRYAFPSGSASPQTITFKTRIPDAAMTNGGTVENIASLTKEDLEVLSNNVEVTIPAPQFTKQGFAGNEETAGGQYNPYDRTITWYITVDSNGRNLNDLAITDALNESLTFDSAQWQLYTGPTPATQESLANDANWADVSGKSWSTVPLVNTYEIGDFNGIGRLKIVTTVPDPSSGDISVGTTTYYNQASVSWESDAGTEGSGTTNNPGVGIGYNTITKSAGTPDTATHQIPWTVNADLRGQSTPETLEKLAIYDLIVHSPATPDSALTGATTTPGGSVAAWPSGLTIGGSGVPRNNGQKYVAGSAAAASGSGHLQIAAIDLYSGVELVGTLLKVTGLLNDTNNTFSFRTQVLDPNVLAGNNTTQDKIQVYNTTTLHLDTTRLGSAQDSVSLDNQILSKELLQRAQVSNDRETGSGSINPNDRTTTAANGFHYGYKEAIFRLNVNAVGLDFANVETNIPGAFGAVTAKDTLPAGWEFVPFQNGADFLIYKGGSFRSGTGYPSTGSLDADGVLLDPSTIEGGLASTFFREGDPETVTFVFGGLNQPYVILLKARPSSDKLDEYLQGSNVQDETNALELNTQNGDIEKIVSQTVRVNSPILNKTVNVLGTEGVARWSVDYTPLGRPIDIGLEDTLPLGIDLRTDSHGQLIWEDSGGNRNINVLELVLDAAGAYTEGSELLLEELQSSVSYDPDTRILLFMFPDNTKAWRLTYTTDITGTPGRVDNQVKLLTAQGDGTKHGAGFMILESHGRATMTRSAYMELRKTARDGATTLPNARFILYNTGLDGSMAAARADKTTDSNGTITFYGLAPGKYLLVEVESPSGYQDNPFVYEIEVGQDQSVTVNGQTVPFTIRNFSDGEPVGNLTLRKIVDGNAGDQDRSFTFVVNLTLPGGGALTGTFDYIGAGVSGGTISSGDSVVLKHGQSITVIGLPAGIGYEVTEQEADADGYVTTIENGSGTIEMGRTALADFTNTKNVGELSITKTVGGNAGDLGKEFTFVVDLTLPGGGTDPGTYPYTGHGVSDGPVANSGTDPSTYPYTRYRVPDGTVSSGGTIVLTHGQSVTIQGLAVGTGFTVTELEANASGYITVADGASGTIELNALRTASFVNIRNDGELSIVKIVEGNAGDTTRKFTFTVNFDLPGSDLSQRPFPYTGIGVPDGTISSGDTIQLSHGQGITIRELQVGTHFVVTEQQANQDGYITTVERGSGSIALNAPITTVFRNTKNLGSLGISKIVSGNAGDKSRRFGFTVDLTQPNGDVDRGTYPYTGIGVPDGTVSSGGIIELAHGQSITIKGLPIGTSYRVTENNANKDGYKTSVKGDSGTITATDFSRFARFTNTKNHAPAPSQPYDPVQAPGYDPSSEAPNRIPQTGDTRNNDVAVWGVAFFSTALVMLAGVEIYLRRRKRV